VQERALRAAAEAAGELGLSVDRPVVLRDSSNLIVHLEPAPVVARVATATATVRPGAAWLAREVAVAGYLAAAGAPVVAPSAELPPGPHERDGMTLTFWELSEEASSPLDAEAAGRALRLCHEALEGFGGELPRYAVVHEAVSILERLVAEGTLGTDDGELLRGIGRDVVARLESAPLPVQAVHGDVHLGNVINTRRGPLWNDWEDTHLAPIDWDLACLHAHGRVFKRDPGPIDAAERGYGRGPDPETLDLFVDARRFQLTVWSLVMARAGLLEQRVAAERVASYSRSS
jgi:hypothetical protein